MNMIIATHNAHKIEEFGRILAPLGITVQTAELTEAEETGTTFRENAYIKAKSACDETGLPCVADDSGLSIDYLNGEPGVYSARYAEPGKRKATVLEKLKGVPEEKRGAHSLAVNEDTILMIGKGGIDGDVVKQAADAIFKRELIKGKVLETAPVSPREAAEALAEQTESEVVQVIGSKFALYKRNEKDPKIVLPRAKKA